MLPGSRAPHIITHKRELRKVLLEALSKVSGLLVIGILVGPGVAGDEDVAGNGGAGGWDMQAKGGISKSLNIIKRSTDGCSDHCSGIVDVDALPDAVGATAPASVDEVAAHVVLLDALA